MYPLWTNTTEVQPHVRLDAVLATLSLGPVGISDGYNLTDVGLIGQAYRSATDGTLLRPSRPLSTLDSALLNHSSSGGRAPCAGDTCNVSSVRGTHSAIPVLSDNGNVESALHTHYIVAWGTRPEATLQPTDLYPAPRRNDVKLGLREHRFEPGATQMAGCVAGMPATSCLTVLEPGTPRVVNATTGGQVRLMALHEQLPNGAFLLGELDKFVHVSPQRFASIKLGGSGPCGFSVEVLGSPNEIVSVVAVDAANTVRVADVAILANGTGNAAM